jgi:hypothetical protein
MIRSIIGTREGVMRSGLLEIGFLGSALAALLPVRASADGGVPPRIFALMQHGQSVAVKIEIAESRVGWGSCVAPGFPCELSREGPDGSQVVSNGPLFVFEDAEATSRHCYSQDDPVGCESAPDECEDCDGDTIKECWVDIGGCYTSYLFTIEDGCVPPGPTTYALHSSQDVEGELGVDDTDSIDVKDTGDPCIPNDSACSVVGVGASTGEGGLALVMMLIGAIAALTSRRRG